MVLVVVVVGVAAVKEFCAVAFGRRRMTSRGARGGRGAPPSTRSRSVRRTLAETAETAAGSSRHTALRRAQGATTGQRAEVGAVSTPAGAAGAATVPGGRPWPDLTAAWKGAPAAVVAGKSAVEGARTTANAARILAIQCLRRCVKARVLRVFSSIVLISQTPPHPVRPTYLPGQGHAVGRRV